MVQLKTKSIVLEILSKMPEDVSMNEIIEALYTKTKIEKAMKSLDAGKHVTHDEVRKRFSQWLPK